MKKSLKWLCPIMSIIQYIEHLLVKANTLMDENLKRIARFEENLMKAVD